MFLQRLKHMLLRLSAEEKVIGVSSLVVILGVFMPWYSMTPIIQSFEKGLTESGFSGDLGVMGFVVFLLTILAVGFLMGDHLHFRFPRFGFKKESIILFFSGESAFLLLLAAAIFTVRSLDYTNAEIRFGLYMALVGSLFATFAAYAQLQKLEKKETKAFFEHDEIVEDGLEAELTEPAPEVKIDKSHHAKRHHVVKEEGRPVIQEKFFEEEFKPLMEEDEPAQSEIEPSNEVIESEPVTPKKEEETSDQGNYFLRDADVPIANEPEKTEQKEEDTPKPANRDMGFYNDL